MKFERVFTTIDTHTGGNPTRTLISGLPPLKGKTMSDKMQYMQKHYDWIRKFLMNEPRGHSVMSGALLTDPCHENADIGVIYIETGGYLPMCGHDTIGFCTALVESGLIELNPHDGYKELKIDTPAGLVEVNIKISNGKAVDVTFVNVPAFLLKTIHMNVDGIGPIDCDIAYGGNFYGLIDARKIGIELHENNASDIIHKAITIRNAINKKEDVVHPEYPFIRGLTHIEFYSDPSNPSADAKNTVVVPPGGIDRSPCGTGTCAKLATLFSRNELAVDETFVHESIVGTLFKSRILAETEMKGYQAVIPEVTGSAWVMGMHRFYYNEEDPLREGFLLIPPMEHHTEKEEEHEYQ